MASTGDLFPPAERVMYAKPPLLQVTCEIRFPIILKIGSQHPVDFQEEIRQIFPILEQAPSVLSAMQLPPELRQAMAANMGLLAGAATWNFFSEDRKSWIGLGGGTMSLTTRSYRTWEDFVLLLRPAMKALLDLYKPAFFSRIGLRYQDLIEREKLGLESVPWSELLRGEVLGEISVKGFESHLLDAKRLLKMSAPDRTGFVVLQHGLGYAIPGGELGYMIDFDFSAEPKTEVANVWPSLENLHSGVGRAFRWCILDRLHDAMEPTPIPR